MCGSLVERPYSRKTLSRLTYGARDCALQHHANAAFGFMISDLVPKYPGQHHSL
jgi:hypothetical protein